MIPLLEIFKESERFVSSSIPQERASLLYYFSTNFSIFRIFRFAPLAKLQHTFAGMETILHEVGIILPSHHFTFFKFITNKQSQRSNDQLNPSQTRQSSILFIAEESQHRLGDPPYLHIAVGSIPIVYDPHLGQLFVRGNTPEPL